MDGCIGSSYFNARTGLIVGGDAAVPKLAQELILEANLGSGCADSRDVRFLRLTVIDVR
ncbi:hypothetical protein [Paenibacillus montanisoli]|uniref:hypothetical protein n=1 Tax=Paenibacillus montanisoli TaxID=2081970 RepID=UPI0014038444|nr:hypothetical protein [Paenibacillus montanisoli]